MANVEERSRKTWVLVKRLDLSKDEETHAPEELKEFRFPHCAESDIIQTDLRKSFNIPGHLVIKLRNQRTSLVPINSKLMSNSKTTPYILEVVHTAQHVQPQPRSIELPGYKERVSNTLHNIEARIEKLENFVPDLKYKRKEKIETEVHDLDRKLQFLNKRFDEAETTSWKGMFKRHPMW